MIKEFNLFFLTLFKIGKIKYAPGTIASAGTCLIFLLLINVFNLLFLFFLTLIIFCYFFIAVNDSYEKFDSNDPQEIVIDEFIGWYTSEENPHIQHTRSKFTRKELERIKKILEK